VNALFRLNENHLFKKNDFHFWGKIIGIDHTGRLKIETETDVEVFGFKEVEFMI
jgi:hypothetical protein